MLSRMFIVAAKRPTLLASPAFRRYFSPGPSTSGATYDLNTLDRDYREPSLRNSGMVEKKSNVQMDASKDGEFESEFEGLHDSKYANKSAASPASSVRESTSQPEEQKLRQMAHEMDKTEKHDNWQGL
ncbi:putative mitochondrial protein [Andalucia godoyi]|uniref:Putative mitochondrial protein n=1 Tax=Andalucia godoyi TaxID=505711 RepID=A0A8K0AIH3_ANDGO|nr:putative mitochondrial protein [Andalucia godoyi]|eukprot:ANDGO_01524.mRNA.1 putative mitochondrial protein